MTARGVILDRNSVPPQSPPILIRQSILSGIESFNCFLTENSHSSRSEPFVKVNLHIQFHVINDGEQASMASYSPKQVRSRIVNDSSDEAFSKDCIDRSVPLYSVGAIR